MSDASAARTGPRAEMFGVPVDLLDMDATVSACESFIERAEGAQHVVLNAGKVVLMRDDPELKRIVSRCEIVNADGQSVVWAARLFGIPVPGRVTGIDLMERLLGSATEHGWPVYFLGAKAEVLEKFAAEVRRRHPSIEVAGAADGYFADDAAAAKAVADSGARLLFVAMPSPRKEYFLAEQRDVLGGVFSMGVGGSFDVWAGLTQRAPMWMRESGLEWFYRFVQEPGRMWKRYLVGNTRFAWIVARGLLDREGEGFRSTFENAPDRE